MLQAIQQIFHLLHVLAQSLHIIQHFRLRILDLCQNRHHSGRTGGIYQGYQVLGSNNNNRVSLGTHVDFPALVLFNLQLDQILLIGSQLIEGTALYHVSASSEVVILEPWLRMWILFPLEPYGIRYRSKNHVQLYFMYVATGG